MNIEGKLFMRERLFSNELAINYVLDTVLTDIDKGSEFEEKNRDLIATTSNPTEYIKQLALEGYDVMLGYDNEKIIGHMVFQEHYENPGSNWQMFRIYITPENRLKGYPVPLAEKFIEKASERGISKVRLGGGKNSIMKKIVQRIKKQDYIEEINSNSLWITLSQQQSQPSL
jgi:GNAT superfamily N-acetyltransferase